MMQGPLVHRGSISDDFSIASMNMRTRKAKEEARVKNPSSRSGPKVVACNHCRARKTRCDGESPCSNCRKRNLMCQYQLSAREAARRKRAQAADLASREKTMAGPSSMADSPRSVAQTQHSPSQSRASSVEPIDSGGFGSGSPPGSVPFTQSYRPGASASPVLHRTQPHPSTSASRPIQLPPVSSQPTSHSPRLSLPPIISFASPPNRPETLLSGGESLKRARSPTPPEEGEGSPPTAAASTETSQSQSKRMRVDALID